MDRKPALEHVEPDQMDTLWMAANQHFLKLRLERYEFASRYCTGPKIADIASGCGYGTALMARDHPELRFVGIDGDQAAVDYAKRHYLRRNVNYFCASLLDQSAVDQFDMVVSLDTIEYLPDPIQTFHALASWVKPGGRLVASVPVTPAMDLNPYQKTDFSVKQFKSHLRRAGFQIGAHFQQAQPWTLAGLKFRERGLQIATNAFRYYRRYPWRVVKRLQSLMWFGFQNNYLTVVGHKI